MRESGDIAHVITSYADIAKEVSIGATELQLINFCTIPNDPFSGHDRYFG